MAKRYSQKNIEALINKLDLVQESMVYEKDDRNCAKNYIFN